MLELLGIPSPAQAFADIAAYFAVSAFWRYLGYGALIVIAAAALGWLFPVLRSLAGAVIVATVGMLVAYRRGEQDAQKREAERRKREQAQARPNRAPRDDGWRWW
ncbi:MAG: hypothetical protein IT536_13815 [Hyphomicrobiales bacterium]|nr:hypothetical protein [Hyphomicrobiales bacterium]